METFETKSVRGTMALGRRLAGRLGVGDCVGLSGGLGAGKTVLVRALASGLGIEDERVVASPTYVLVREYAGRLPIYHVDLYRMSDAPAELAALGIEEMLADGVVLVEWADRAAAEMPRPRWDVRIEITGRTSRRLQVRRVD
jgi:tRNA threonylcarbamoyladenosine biosynthesis protein TsaE